MSSTAAARQIAAAYGDWALRLQEDGWTPSLLTLMFRQLRGTPTAVARQMERETERVYGRFITRVRRNPHALSSIGRLPLWICSPDYPVFKHAKQSLADVTVNDGRHLHVIDFQPPAAHSRLPVPIADHFASDQGIYVHSDYPLLRLHAVPITHDLGAVVDYTLKALRRGLLGEDGVFILPRSRSELPMRGGLLKGQRGAGAVLGMRDLSDDRALC
ncbi:hypothetical protein MKK84_27355 [Methylobacterium sp. E-065]|uniref:hypothetical protein n=1 Tax=Methylobacterium sp. E-065 TaxID=2836583 RepID=UPI001FBBC6C2|nr:hypothetical protein [Methylobacterium sp. E-065]MCJ2021092.1 hypothetical protein [Methylobacterium sp. E-065]